MYVVSRAGVFVHDDKVCVYVTMHACVYMLLTNMFQYMYVYTNSTECDLSPQPSTSVAMLYHIPCLPRWLESQRWRSS